MSQNHTETDDALRARIAQDLAAGLAVTVWPRPASDDLTLEIVTALQTHPADDLTGRMVIAGLTNHPVEFGGIAQSCGSCVYFMVHHRKCEQPEVDLPVEPEWSCRLWRM